MLADRDPDPLGGRRHVDMIDLVFAPEALDDRIDDRGARADGTGFAGALDAERIGLAGDVMSFEHKGRTVIRARHCVIHERSGDELAIGRAVDHLLHQGLPDALHRTAMNLSLKQERV